MKIVDYDSQFFHTFKSSNKIIEFFEKEYKQPNYSIDFDATKVLIDRVINNKFLELLDSTIKGKYSFGFGSLNVSFKTINETVIASGFSKFGEENSPLNLSEYIFWEKMSSAETAEDKISVFYNYLESIRGGSYNSRFYEIRDPSIVSLIEDAIFFINKDENPKFYTECLKTYLYPAIDKSIDFLEITKSLEEEKDKRLYRAWKNSGFRQSSDPRFFEYYFNKIKRSNGYVEEKLRIINYAFDCKAVDKKLAKLFIKKSTIRIRRNLAMSFANHQARINQCISSSQTIIKNLNSLQSIEDESMRKSTTDLIQRSYNYITRSSEEGESILSYNDFYSLSFDDKVEYLNQLILDKKSQSEMPQSGLIHISAEEDYEVQDNVCRYISKENSVWVLPNIKHSYHQRLINEKLVGA
jgi:hypothetical protein